LIAGCDRPASPRTAITVMAFQSGGFREHFTRAVIEPFTEAHPDIAVNFYGVRNSAMELGVLRAYKRSGMESGAAPPADVTIIDLSVAKIAFDEGLFDEVHADHVPNAADLQQTGAELGRFGLPATYDTLTLVYDTRRFTTAPTSWTELWNPAHRGRVVIPAEGGGDIQAIALTIIANRLAGHERYDEDVAPGVERLVQLAPSVQTWEPKPDLYTLVANGTATIGIGWNARSQAYVDQSSGRLGSIAPDEGTVSQVNVISLIKGSRQRETAEVFINYALGVDAQKRFAESMYYVPTNAKAQIAEAARRRMPLLDEGYRSRLIPVDWLAVGRMREQLLEPWRRRIIPASR
jgi:putative spermidine/putrescine transport system substrate-binding protein